MYSTYSSSRIANALRSINYEKVTEVLGDNTDNAGKNIYYYQYDNNHEYDYLKDRLLPYPFDHKSPSYYLLKYRNWDNGMLTRKESYKQNESEPYQTNDYNYIYHYNSKTYKNTYIFKLTNYTSSGMCGGYSDEVYLRNNLVVPYLKGFPNSQISDRNIDYILPHVYGYYNYEIEPGWLELESEDQYEKINNKLVTTTTSYLYQGANTYYPSSIERTRSDGGVDKQTMKYPYDFTTMPYSNMVNSNILYPVVETSKYKNSSFIESTKTNYKDWANNIFKPMSVDTKVGNNDYETRVTFDAFDSNANLLGMMGSDYIKKCYIWGYNNMYPVVEIIGMATSDLNTSIRTNISNHSFSFQSSSDAIKTDIDFLKSQLSSILSNSAYQVTLYTYMPLTGMTSQTNPQGITTYYEYDELSRLKCVKDNYSKMLHMFNYNYKH